MLFRAAELDNFAHISAPTESPFDGAPWSLCSKFFSGNPGAVIAPDVIATAGHVAPGILPGMTFVAMGTTRSVVNQITTPPTWGADVAFFKMNGTYPNWAWLWNNEYWTKDNWIFCVSPSLGRGPYGTDGLNEWWEVADASTFAVRWGATRPDFIDKTSKSMSFGNRFRLDNDPGSFGCVAGDSGSPCFIDAGPNKEWLYLGPVVGGVAGDTGSHAIWDRPDFPHRGMTGAMTFTDIAFCLSLGCRILPPQLIITQPADEFTLDASSLVVRGTTIGNPSRVKVKLTY